MKASGLANRIGTSILPFTNPRVVCPPGTPSHSGRINLVVATPMRSGTHLMIDLILNNLRAYKKKPLYIDLDQCVSQSGRGHDLVAEIRGNSGHVIKTHLPKSAAAEATRGEVQRVWDAAVVITVRRDRDAVMRSLSHWDRSEEAMSRHQRDYDAFWAFWSQRRSTEVTFEQLFEPTAMTSLLDELAGTTGTRRTRQLMMPAPPRHRRRIYLTKAATRLAGRRAPRIDTTIHTLKG